MADFLRRGFSVSKLFRNVPIITHERMSPLLLVVLSPFAPAGGRGRRGGGGERRPRGGPVPRPGGARAPAREAARVRPPSALIPFQYRFPTPTPSRRHG